MAGSSPSSPSERERQPYGLCKGCGRDPALDDGYCSACDPPWVMERDQEFSDACPQCGDTDCMEDTHGP